MENKPLSYDCSGCIRRKRHRGKNICYDTNRKSSTPIHTVRPMFNWKADRNEIVVVLSVSKGNSCTDMATTRIEIN